jgi:heme-degrading monooxygenase HmoA
VGIFISYWENREAINAWKQNATHIMAKDKARKWYKRYLSQICKVEHSYLMENN